MEEARLLAIMEAAVEEAKRSTAEDDGPRPKVAAVLADFQTGKIILRAHRGELPGAHAEYCLLKKAEAQRIPLAGTVLFTTLEPCVWRGSGKVPCAERVAASGIKQVYIGTLDPNPYVTGRGEMLLTYADLAVGRFPLRLSEALRDINKNFFDEHRSEHNIGGYARSGRYSLPPRFSVEAARKSSDRNRLLQSTLDVINCTRGSLEVRAGDISWLREAYITLLAAAFDGRTIRFLTTPPEPADGREEQYWQAIQALKALGATIGLARKQPIAKYTMSVSSQETAAIVVDRKAARLLVSGEDDGMLALLHESLDMEWTTAEIVNSAKKPRLEIIPDDHVFDALAREVPAYHDAEISRRTVPLMDTVPLTNNLERFKLARLRQLEPLLARHGYPLMAVISGSPWPISPPVVEIHDGRHVVIDGTHRVYDAIEAGRVSMDMVVVEGVANPLPAEPMPSWEEARATLVKLPREERYSGYKRERFRPLRYAFARASD